MYPLIADGGELTVLRSLAAFSYGQWSVEWPDSVPEEQRPVLVDDREFGYAAKLKKEPGRMGRRFVRADVSIKAADFTSAGEQIRLSGYSDVEAVLDAAAQRTDGEALFEREITRAGLGSLVPHVDFDVNDVVPVLIWGKLVDSLVTSITAKVESGAVVDWAVHVGGSLLADDAARARSNREIEAAIIAERRERNKAVSAVRSTAQSAKSTADSAKSQSDANAASITALEAALAELEAVDVSGEVEAARDAVEQARQFLELVRQHTAAASGQASNAQMQASLAIEYADRAEEILDQLDPLRDDVVAAHAEVARLSGEASLAAQKAAEHVARGEQHVLKSESAASSAAASAGKSQKLVDEAKAVLSSVQDDADAAKKALADAGALLENVDGSGRSLGDVLTEVARLHQETLSKHDEILTVHGDVLEIHGDAIKWAAMAAAAASQSAQQAAWAAEEALHAADLNSQAIEKLAEADKKLVEADKKLQAQIDLLEESQRLLAKGLRAAAVAASSASAASQSAAWAADENANAIEQVGIAVDLHGDALLKLEDAVKKLNEATRILGQAQAAQKKATDAASAAATDAQKVSRDVATNLAEFKKATSTANDARDKALETLVLQNHGQWYIGSSFSVPRGVSFPPFDSQKGYRSGCFMGKYSDGSRYIEMGSAGDWQIHARLNVNAPFDFFKNQHSIMMYINVFNPSGSIHDQAITYLMQGDGTETLQCTLATTIPASGYRAQVKLDAEASRGDGLILKNQVGSSHSEFSVRQLSKVL